jgi:hypothetical protein
VTRCPQVGLGWRYLPPQFIRSKHRPSNTVFRVREIGHLPYPHWLMLLPRCAEARGRIPPSDVESRHPRRGPWQFLRSGCRRPHGGKRGYRREAPRQEIHNHTRGITSAPRIRVCVYATNLDPAGRPPMLTGHRNKTASAAPALLAQGATWGTTAGSQTALSSLVRPRFACLLLGAANAGLSSTLPAITRPS